MAFRLSKKASQWFTHISGNKNGFDLFFDSYYFCLIAGLRKGRKETFTNNQTTEIIQQFPKDYLPNKHLIIALFLHTELNSFGIDLHERTILNKHLSQLIEPNSATNLSDEGMRILNQYSFGGSLVLQEHFPEAPRTLDGFLVGFYKFINGPAVTQ